MVDKLKGLFGGGSDDNASQPEPAAAADTPLKGMFGGGSSSDSATTANDGHNDFVKRYTSGDPNDGYTAEEAKQHFQTVLKTATPDQLQIGAEANSCESSGKPARRAWSDDEGSPAGQESSADSALWRRDVNCPVTIRWRRA